jgi:hypothetical protein
MAYHSGFNALVVNGFFLVWCLLWVVAVVGLFVILDFALYYFTNQSFFVWLERKVFERGRHVD